MAKKNRKKWDDENEDRIDHRDRDRQISKRKMKHIKAALKTKDIDELMDWEDDY